MLSALSSLFFVIVFCEALQCRFLPLFLSAFFYTSAVLELILGLPCGFTDRFLLFNLMVYGVDDHPFSLITLFLVPNDAANGGRARAPVPMGRWGGWLSDR